MWAATGRSGGVSSGPYASLNLAGHVGDSPESVGRNRRAVVRALGLPGDRLAVMDAVHGCAVAQVAAPGVFSGVDALVTSEPGLALMALGADCVPMAVIGADGRTVAAAHCGWRGLVVDVVGAVVSAVLDHGTVIAQVILGPAVCGDCYPVPPDRLREMASACSAAVLRASAGVVVDGQPSVDVRSGVRARLLELGIPDSAIRHAGGCTVEDPTLFSYRRDGVTGRQGMVVSSGRRGQSDGQGSRSGVGAGE